MQSVNRIQIQNNEKGSARTSFCKKKALLNELEQYGAKLLLLQTENTQLE